MSRGLAYVNKSGDWVEAPGYCWNDRAAKAKARRLTRRRLLHNAQRLAVVLDGAARNAVVRLNATIGHAQDGAPVSITVDAQFLPVIQRLVRDGKVLAGRAGER